ncbi:HdeD family acid-resistance protein [Nocardia sp. NPDC059228]|uniref:HdeD family acid-resistance protein n=1 Tax=Nocardia sp. NPDC059228 TaxID=3346777 RepID=UPI00367DDFC0
MTAVEPLNNPLPMMARVAWQTIPLTGILSAVLGVLILAWPGPTLVVAGVLFGIYLIVAGVLQLATAFGDHVPAGVRVLALLSGALSLILGFLCFRDALESIFLLALVTGWWLIVLGVMEAIHAVQMRRATS